MGVPAGGHCEALDRQTSVPAAMSSFNSTMYSSPSPYRCARAAQ
jgi:hypothetical protein